MSKPTPVRKRGRPRSKTPTRRAKNHDCRKTRRLASSDWQLKSLLINAQEVARRLLPREIDDLTRSGVFPSEPLLTENRKKPHRGGGAFRGHLARRLTGGLSGAAEPLTA